MYYIYAFGNYQPTIATKLRARIYVIEMATHFRSLEVSWRQLLSYTDCGGFGRTTTKLRW